MAYRVGYVAERDSVERIDDCLTSERPFAIQDCATSASLHPPLASVITIVHGLNVSAFVPVGQGRHTFDALRNDTMDMRLAQSTMTAQRVDDGIVFSMATTRVQYGILVASDAPLHLANTNILVGQSTDAMLCFVAIALLLLAVVFAVGQCAQHHPVAESLWLFCREVVPGSNTNSFANTSSASLRVAVLSVGLLTSACAVGYQASMARTFIVTSVDHERLVRRVGDDIGGGRVQLIMNGGPHRALYRRLQSGDGQFSRQMQRGVRQRPVWFTDDAMNAMHMLGRTYSAAIMPTHRLHMMLGALDDRSCQKFVILPLPIDTAFAGIALNARLSRAHVDELNMNILTRYTFIQRSYDKSRRLSGVCRQHLLRHSDSHVSFNALSTTTLSGAFLLIVVVTPLALGALLVELVYDKLCAAPLPPCVDTAHWVTRLQHLNNDEMQQMSECYEQLIAIRPQHLLTDLA